MEKMGDESWGWARSTVDVVEAWACTPSPSACENCRLNEGTYRVNQDAWLCELCAGRHRLRVDGDSHG